MLYKKVDIDVTLMRLSKNPISLNLQYQYDFMIYFNTHTHTRACAHYLMCPLQKPMNNHQHRCNEWALLHKMWLPNIISCWKELMPLREIADSKSMLGNEQDEALTSCHNYKQRKLSSVLSKEPRSQFEKALLGQSLGN